MDNTNFIDLEGHIIKSSMQDEHQIIKIVEKTPEVKNIGKIVSGDTNSNILTFEMNRYYDNVDLIKKDIKFIVKNELGMFTEDAVNFQYNDNLIRFSWVLSDSVTYKSESVSAAISFIGNEAGQKYTLKTLPFTIKIENSLDFMECAIEYKNWFTDIETRLLDLENQNGSNEDQNLNGKSAYEIAVENGFSGSESEWLLSLRGEKGETGKDGKDGDTGLSAYEIAVKNGFSGTETTWIESLKGDSGTPGSNGQDGVSISSIVQTAISTDDGGTNIITVTLSNGVTSTFEIKNGLTGEKGEKGDPGQDASLDNVTAEDIGAASKDHIHGYMKTITISATEPDTVADGEIVMVYEE